MQSLHVLPVHVWIFSGYFSFLSKSKDMRIRSSGYFKVPTGVNASVNGCLSFCVGFATVGDRSMVYLASHPKLVGVGCIFFTTHKRHRKWSSLYNSKHLLRIKLLFLRRKDRRQS